MDKDVRNLIASATQRARRLLEREFSEQLEGTYDILPDGRIPADPGHHLDDRGQILRAKLVAAVRHRQAGGLSAKDAVDATVREAAFTTLNRFVALKMLEARGMVQECISKGDTSAGFKEYGGLAPGLADLPDKGYRLYLESLFDEIGREVRVLFDRRDVGGMLWPRRLALGELLDALNDTALAEIWQQDETIGWIYQYFNGEDERRKMRDESQAPRNSRELAVRNQFFTPRYVVEFLTDNTLGRTWYEMRSGDTRLRDACRYLVCRPDEVFLADAEQGGSDDPAIAQDRAFLAGDAETIFPFRLPAGTWHSDSGAIPNHERDNAELRLISFAHAVRPFAWPDDARQLEWQELLQQLATGGPEDPVSGRSQDLWDCLLMVARAERFNDGIVPKYGLAHTRIANEIRRRLLAARQPDATQEQTLNVPVLVPYRAKKDPRDLKVLDPACGSGHFLLYCFDLLLTIYEEGWADEDASVSVVTSMTLRADYPTLDALRSALPGLILRYNLHGIDIDPRAAQIAELALWMRAQRAYSDYNFSRDVRQPIRKTNVVVAEPMPGERAMLHDFLRGVDPRLHHLVHLIWDKMMLADEAGALLQIEREIADIVDQTRRERLVDEATIQDTLYEQDHRLVQGLLTSSTEERTFWDSAEEKMLIALHDFAAAATSSEVMSRHLFSENAAQGFAFVDLCHKKYDVVLMNPPFGAASISSKAYVENTYPRGKHDLYSMFVERGINLACLKGIVGAITSRTGFFLLSSHRWRAEVLLMQARPTVFADLGGGVMDAAMVEAAAYCLEVTR